MPDSSRMSVKNRRAKTDSAESIPSIIMTDDRQELSEKFTRGDTLFSPTPDEIKAFDCSGF
jgi:hypothetical protein